MFAISEMNRILYNEKNYAPKNNHAIIFMLVRPDKNGMDIIDQFNYLNYYSAEYCTIYPLGYDLFLHREYKDIKKIKGVNNVTWEYSDECFIKFLNILQKWLKGWTYSGEPQLIVFQNYRNDKNEVFLDFSTYYVIDINEGLRRNYFSSFNTFIQNLLDNLNDSNNIKYLTTRNKILKLNCRKIIANSILDKNYLVKEIKSILANAVFFKPYHNYNNYRYIKCDDITNK